MRPRLERQKDDNNMGMKGIAVGSTSNGAVAAGKFQANRH